MRSPPEECPPDQTGTPPDCEENPDLPECQQGEEEYIVDEDAGDEDTTDEGGEGGSTE